MYSPEISHLLLLFPLVVTLHMLEEVIWLPGWSLDAGKWHEPVTRGQFAPATAVFLLFVYAISFFTWRTGSAGLSLYLILGTAVVLLVNILLPHLGATIVLRRYAPGLASALLFNLPFMSYLLWRAFQELPLSPLYFLLGTLVMLLAAAILWPLLLRLGKESSRV